MYSFKNGIYAMLIVCFLGLAVQGTLAAVTPEMEGMDVVTRGDGTFLIGSPTYYYDRILGAGGMHSESELWSPRKLRQRLLFNRMSIDPSWDPLGPSVWVKTGNELGDMIYNDLIVEENRPTNRTPILEGGFRSPSFKGFWATARAFQDDHYSNITRSSRLGIVSDEFALFGENYPMFSSAYAGLGFTNSLVNASALVGEEYLWLYGESSRWIPVHYKPRVEARADVGSLSLTAVYEDAEYQNVKKDEKGSRKEVNGSIYYRCGDVCQQGVMQLSAGLYFRAVEDSGVVYTGLEEDVMAFPFMELRLQPHSRVTADAMFGINDRDWLVQDSIEFRIPTPKQMGGILGVKNVSGTRLNPVADDKEYFDADTIDLAPDGQMNMVQGYLALSDTIGNFGFGGRTSYWAEYGAESFDTTSTYVDGSLTYRHGDVTRINSWIYGITGELWLSAWYKNMFAFKAMGGYEHLEGVDRQFEVNPAEFYTSFTADWLLRKSFRISHALHYRSDARWNLRSNDPMVVKGGWYWDATFEQQFIEQGLFLTGSILHTLGDELIEVPNGDYGRVRFVCSVRKTF